MPEHTEINRFTQRARRVQSLAAEEAYAFQHPHIGTEHILLGLIREEGGVAARVLKELGINLENLRHMIGELSPQTTNEGRKASELAFNDQANKALQYAIEESKRLGKHYIGTEHILLGVIMEDQYTAVQILEKSGISRQAVRAKTQEILQQSPVAYGFSDYLKKVAFELKPVAYSTNPDLAVSARSLGSEVENLRIQIQELRKEIHNEKTVGSVEQIAQLAERIEERGRELSAPIVLPPIEDMNVRLVPSHSLERLEEYRSDESIAFLLIGLFAGAILGVIVNWSTSESFVITRFSIVLICLLVSLAAMSGLWASRLRKRADSIRNRMLRQNVLVPTSTEDGIRD